MLLRNTATVIYYSAWEGDYAMFPTFYSTFFTYHIFDCSEINNEATD